MTLEEKVGQLLMVGFRGLEAGPRSPILRAVESGLVGGVILFDRDVKLRRDGRNVRDAGQLRRLVARLQRAAPRPLLVAVDQEGGQVSRLKPRHGFPETPAARALGAEDDPALTRRCAEGTAAALAAIGVNLNFAPVVDLDVFPGNPIIGRFGRSYSADPAVVARHAREVIAAHAARGIACCLKHFPGHGSSRGDSHLGFTDVSDTWTPAELEPFRELIAGGNVEAVMTAHVFNRRLDPEHPASLSRPTVSGLLRRDLGFAGAVLSDDLDMGAVASAYPRERALELALNAGNDILLIANNLEFRRGAAERAHQALVRLARSGRVPAARVDEAWQRVRKLKQGRA